MNTRGSRPRIDYTRLSLADVRAGLLDVARIAETSFGDLDVRQLNWRPAPHRWSVAQCLEHLFTGNGFMLHSAERALSNPPSSVWQRLPILPWIFGQLLVRSQGPGTAGKYKAPATATPSPSEIDPDIVQRFIDQQREAARWVGTLDERDAARKIMISPFVSFITYSVLDGCRLAVAHDHRHVEQARRVTLSAEFPKV